MDNGVDNRLSRKTIGFGHRLVHGRHFESRSKVFDQSPLNLIQEIENVTTPVA